MSLTLQEKLRIVYNTALAHGDDTQATYCEGAMEGDAQLIAECVGIAHYMIDGGWLPTMQMRKILCGKVWLVVDYDEVGHLMAVHRFSAERQANELLRLVRESFRRKPVDMKEKPKHNKWIN